MQHLDFHLCEKLKKESFPQNTLLGYYRPSNTINPQYLKVKIKSDISSYAINTINEEKKGFGIFASPSFQEIWEQLPKIIINNENQYDLMLSDKYICYEYIDYSIESIHAIKVIDNNVTEAIAKLWLTLKSLNLLDDIHDSGVITNL